MRVLRLTPFFYHDCVTDWPAAYDPVGGMQTQITQLSEWLASRGVEQIVLTLGHPGVPRIRTLCPGLTVHIARAPLLPIKSRLTGIVGLVQAWLVMALIKAARLRRTWQPDLVHVHADGQVWPMLAALASRRLVGVPYVLTVHCSRLAGYRPWSRADRLQHPLVQAIERLAARRAAAVVTLTATTAAALVRAGVPSERVVVVPDTLHYEASSVRGQRPVDSPPLVGFVGRIAHEKGWPDVLALAERVDARFIVVGDGPQADTMRREVTDRGLADRFTFTGFVPHREVAGYLRQMDVVVMPSVHEELGSTSLEAMAQGTPVVAYAVGGLPRTVGEVLPSLLVSAGDVEAFAGAVHSVLADPAPYRAAIAARRSWMAANFGADANLPRLEQVYRAAAGVTDPVVDRRTSLPYQSLSKRRFSHRNRTDTSLCDS
jgi:2-deoxystreptamine N-acetyl-D-glucosaminyltransferase/2-deoxystreptamine glucosyltransferase